MRWLKIVLTVIVVLAAAIGGLFIAAIAAVAGLGLLLARRFFSPPSRPKLPPTPPVSPRRTTSRDAGDAIEITATEIPHER